MPMEFSKWAVSRVRTGRGDEYPYSSFTGP